MEKKIHWTRIKGEDKVFGRNDYVTGVIAGISSVVCGDAVCPHLLDRETGDTIVNAVCTPSVYQIFVGLVSKKYPNLCEFDCEVNIEEKFKRGEES